jgi:hypothetical protein
MATDTAWATSVLDEAAVIVEAEWMRLQQDEALWECELADLPADLPAPRPGPPRVGVTTTCGGGQANRGPTTVAGGRRGDGLLCRYGRPSGLLRRARCPAERHCRTGQVMPPSMITSRQRRPVPATITPMSCHRFRLQRAESVCVTHRHWWWHVEVDPCTASLPSPGRPQDGRGVRPAATRAPRPQRVSDLPQRCAGLMS